VRRAAVTAVALACACNTGRAASPAADGSVVVVPGSGEDAGDAQVTGDAVVAGDDSSPLGYPTDAHVVADSCAATGTCLPTTAQVFASGLATPGGIVLDSTSVYWVDVGVPLDGGAVPDSGRAGSQILKCAKSGCGGLASVVASDAQGALSKLAVDATNVYWIVTNGILSCPLAGCSGSPGIFWSGTNTPYDIAADASGVYFTLPTASRVVMCPAAGCGSTPAVLYPGGDAGAFFGQPTALTLDATSLYFAVSNNGVVACTKADCASTWRTVGTASGAFSLVQLAVDGQNVYANEGAGSAGARLFFAPKTGTGQSMQVLASGITAPVGLAADGTNVYFVEDGTGEAGLSGFGRVSMCAMSGCTAGPHIIADYLNFPLGLAVDGTSVYWTDYGTGTTASGTTTGRVMVWTK
jgi:hypothetical protein